MDPLTGTRSPGYGSSLERKPTDPHFRTMDAGRLAIDGNAPEYRALPDKACHFEVYRADEIRTSSVLFAGGDWHWQLSDAAGEILVEAGGYRSEVDCRKAVAMLRRHVPFALFPTRA